MRKIILILMLLLLIASACNGDGEDSDNPTEPAATATAETATTEPEATEAVDAAETTPDPSATEETSSAGSAVLVLGDISGNPADSLEEMQPLVDYLESHLEGVSEVTARVAPDIETMISWMESGEVDLYFDSLYPAMIISDQANAQPILRRWKDEVDQYRAVIFALSSSDLTNLEDLQGHSVAFDEASSTSGYMLPLWLLLDAGLTVVEKPATTTPVEDNEVGYVFSGDDENTIQWVISGRITAGAIDNLTLADIPQETLDQLVVLGESEDIPRQIGIVAADVDPALVSNLIEVLMAMDEDPAAAEALDEFDTSQFDEFPEGAEPALARMREIYDAVQTAQQE